MSVQASVIPQDLHRVPAIPQKPLQERLSHSLLSICKQEIHQHGSLHPRHFHNSSGRKADGTAVLYGDIGKTVSAGHIQIAEPDKGSVPGIP